MINASRWRKKNENYIHSRRRTESTWSASARSSCTNTYVDTNDNSQPVSYHLSLATNDSSCPLFYTKKILPNNNDINRKDGHYSFPVLCMIINMAEEEVLIVRVPNISITDVITLPVPLHHIRRTPAQF